MIEALGPFGISNPEPRFIFSDIRIIKADIVGKDHVRCILGSQMAGGMGGSLKAMAFRCADVQLGQSLLGSNGRNCQILGKLKLNKWQGLNRPEIIIEDVLSA